MSRAEFSAKTKEDEWRGRASQSHHPRRERGLAHMTKAMCEMSDEELNRGRNSLAYLVRDLPFRARSFLSVLTKFKEYDNELTRRRTEK